MKIKKWIIQIFFIVLLLTIFFILNDSKRNVNVDEVNYLNKNASMEIQFKESDLEKKAFIVSELHGFKENQTIKYQLLTNLNKVNHIHYYLAEISFSSGYLLNEYLQTGDENLLKLVFSFYKGSTFYTKEEYKFYQDLYQYNLNQSNDNKIIVIGIDIEHSLDSTIYFYNEYMHESITLKEDILNQTFKDPLLIHLQNNIIYNEDFYKNFDWQARDKAMFNNYRFLQSYYQIESFYAQLGAKHTLTEIESDQYRSFAYLLNSDDKSNVKGSVLSMMTFYKDSEYIESYTLNNKSYYKSEFVNRTYQTNNLDSFQNPITFITLKETDSPYEHKLVWYNLSKNECGKVTTDYYQYMILINHSKSNTPLDESMEKSQWNYFLNVIKKII